jgi:UDP-glucose 4-epimerase
MVTNWLITGGCGFIGTNLIKRLISEGGHTIRVLDNLSVGTKKDLGNVCEFSEKNSSLNTVELIIGDIKDPETCISCAKDMDIIVHLAANTGVGPSVEDPRADMETNVTGTFNMLEAARQNNVKRFVFASSGAPVGECEPPIHEELAPHPVSPYGASKLAGEGYCSAYYRSFGLETVALRFGNVYGPGSGHKNSVVAKFIKQAMQGETMEIYGDGSQTRDFIYIDDLINAVYKSGTLNTSKSSPSSLPNSDAFPLNLNPDIGGEIFQIATSRETTVSEMAGVLIEALNKAGVGDIKMAHRENRLGDVMRNFSDTSKAKKILGWQAQIHLAKGLKRTVEWFV